LNNFRANPVFRASARCSKILNDKKYFNTGKNFRAICVFQGKRKLFKNPEWYSEFRANSVFRASASCTKVLNGKKYFNTGKIFRSTLFFRASARCSKILNDKNIYSMQ